MKRILALLICSLAAVFFWAVPVCGDAFSVYINGTAAEMDHIPIVNSGKVFFEIEDLFGLKARTTTWDPNKGLFVAALGDSTYLYDPANNILKAGEQIYYLKEPPLNIKGETYVCVQEFEQALNFRAAARENRVDLSGDLVPNPVSGGFPHYEIEAVYAEGKIYGWERVNLVNLRNRAVQDLLLVLPAPSINPKAKTKVYSVMLDGVPMEFQEGETYLRVVLPHSLEPKEKLELEISFDTLVPQGPSRLGYTGSCAVLTCWYPVVSLDASVPVYSSFGEPYSFQSGVYSVDLKVEKNLQVFSSLEQVAKIHEGDSSHYQFSSSLPIREAAFVVGHFRTETVASGGTQVCYAYNHYRSGVAEYAAKAMELFGQWWGIYPYPSLTLVEVPLAELHGMEYGGMVLLSSINQHDPFIVVHEVAHQWWQGMVGNNQEKEAWIDEGLANYSTLLFFEHTAGGYSNYLSRIRSMESQAGREGGKLERSLLDYSSEEEYRRNAYVRGALVWHQVRRQVGRNQLLAFLRSIQQHYRFSQITTEEIFFLLNNAFPTLELT